MNLSSQSGVLMLLALTCGSCSRTPEATPAPAIRVGIEVASLSAQGLGRCYSGTVEESAGTVLSFSASGTVRQMHVNVGDHVAAGSLIASLDATNLRHAYGIAEAALNQAQDAYNRMRLLHEADALPEIRWVEVQNTLEQARSAAAIARKGLDDASLYAPCAGYISEKMADAGMNVAPGMPVVRLVDINPVKVKISVPENEISAITSDASAIIKVSAAGERSFAGTLAEKSVVANPLSRSYEVKFRVQNPDGALLPGMICELTMTADSAASVLTVSSDAVLLDADNNTFVWLSHHGHALKRVVATRGMSAGTRIIIQSGLVPGDSVIVSGQQKVSQGTTVVNATIQP